MLITLILDDPAQLLLPFPGVTYRPAPAFALVPPPLQVVHTTRRDWVHEPRRADLSWSDDHEEAA